MPLLHYGTDQETRGEELLEDSAGSEGEEQDDNVAGGEEQDDSVVGEEDTEVGGGS